MNLDDPVLKALFGADTGRRVYDCWAGLVNTPDFHKPTAWRSRVPELCALDHVGHNGGSVRTSLEMMHIAKFFGSLSLDLRDVPGLGHARLLSLIDNSGFDDVLTRVAKAESYCAVCITEPDCGSDLRAMKTTAVRVDGGYQITGRKQYISRLRQADYYLVFAMVEGAGRGLTIFLIPAAADGLKVSDISAGGLRGCSWGALDLSDVLVPKCHTLGGEGQGSSLFSKHFSFWRCMMASAALGTAQSALSKARDRMSVRQSFGGVIGRFTHLQQEYAKHASRVHMAWLLVVSAASRIDKQCCSYVDAAMAKAESVEYAIGAVRWCQLMHGANGYSDDCGLIKMLDDLLGLSVADGTTDVLRGQVARGLLGEQLYLQSLGRNEATESLMRERQLW
ncbi:acyl-CoA dehydrogenase [Pseudomonas syringae]|uniref:Acyl-CoA dehydrogenase n=1 Tax=Pseudomonas syringae TaxID=317 RepID=A0A085VLW5_PSESX|nr:acyl-CoA dehydrogenase [Pseudomonas syringae]KFE56428.1 hypothetical protein IV02_00920 [Pseudomonas syringae]